MLDVVIRGGLVADGSGAPGRVGDVGIKDGRIVAVGAVDEPAAQQVDAQGAIVAPGFVDVHTHYDAQVFWDPDLTPSPLHGVTSVIGGNCGFTIAPLDAARDGDYMMRMLARVEGMPLETLQAGVPWGSWNSFAEYLDRIEGNVTPNAGFMVGHSAIRRAVMHDDAHRKESTPEQVAAMVALLEQGLAAGGLGFSSTWSTTHNDHLGGPVPSRCGNLEELLALCAAVKAHPGTVLEFIPGLMPWTDETFEVMAQMSIHADRPLNWNVLQVTANSRESNERQLAASDYAAARGGKVVALTLPDTLRTRLTFKSGFVLDVLQHWSAVMALPDAEKLAYLADPDKRRQLDEWAQSSPQRNIAHWAAYTIVEAFGPDTKRFVGRTVKDIAEEQGKRPFDALLDIVIEDNLLTAISPPDRGQDDVSWQRRVEAWRDPRTLVGASDAGAHVDMIDSFSLSTLMLGKAVRQRGLLSWEEAVQLLTDAPATFYGLRERGRLQPGFHADVVVFDPTRVGSGPLHTRFDLPGGAGRLYADAEGIEHVFVNGAEVVRGRELTGARPGTVLRSGRDTATVTASGR